MAVKDDVLSGESYYIREIKYLKRMTELCSQGSLLFLAIDEILKGTNTKERIAASKAVLDYFSKQHCMLMVATHDLELAKAFDKTYDNYHFAEVIGTQDVRFDYELHKGISNSSNAIKLLSAIGFPKQIIDMAQSEAEKDTV
jgi:DNA mismatch repair ATPase MutS